MTKKQLKTLVIALIIILLTTLTKLAFTLIELEKINFNN